MPQLQTETVAAQKCLLLFRVRVRVRARVSARVRVRVRVRVRGSVHATESLTS